jgi:hypothetical protein
MSGDGWSAGKAIRFQSGIAEEGESGEPNLMPFSVARGEFQGSLWRQNENRPIKHGQRIGVLWHGRVVLDINHRLDGDCAVSLAHVE